MALSKKRASKRKRGKRDLARRDQAAEAAARHGSSTRRLTPIRLGLGLGVLVIGVAIVWTLTQPHNGVSTLPGDGGPPTTSSAVAPDQARSGLTGLPPATPGTKEPINSADPMTAEEITSTSPTTLYKGYVVAFCCPRSPAYNGGWARMGKAEKDAFIRRCLE